MRIKRRIEDLEQFDPASSTKRHDDPKVTQLKTAIRSTLQDIFGIGTPEFARYSAATRLDHGPISMDSSWITSRGGGFGQRENFHQYLAEGRAQALALLNQAVKDLEEEIEFGGGIGEAPLASLEAQPEHLPSRRVFIVHGHDEAARESVARYLNDLGFEPVILHEQANRGGTVIEKIEANADVGFAVVLLTPDDKGAAKDSTELEPRARQNVLLELGYFLARLGRPKVCALRKGDVSIPSDFAGVVWEPMDTGHGWKLALGRELKAAGFEVDLNKAFAA